MRGSLLKFLIRAMIVGIILMNAITNISADPNEDFRIRSIVDRKLDRIIILFQGEIVLGISDHFERLLAKQSDIPIVAVLDSPGGVLDEGMRLGRVFRSIRVTTFVPSWGECLSACTLSYIGGDSRTVDKGALLGVHRFWHLPGTLGGADPDLLVGRTQETSGLILSYFIEMGIDARAAAQMLLTPSPSMRIFSDDELIEFGLDQPLPPGVDTVDMGDHLVVVSPRLWEMRMRACKEQGLIMCPSSPESTIQASELPNWRADWFSNVSDIAGEYAIIEEVRRLRKFE